MSTVHNLPYPRQSRDRPGQVARQNPKLGGFEAAGITHPATATIRSGNCAHGGEVDVAEGAAEDAAPGEAAYFGSAGAPSRVSVSAVITFAPGAV